MATNTLSRVLQQLRRAALARDGAGPTDGELLGRYLAGRDETAFEALVRRHGPMVLGVCQRLLGNRHDAEDAFQATFLVLVRRAAAVVPRDLVGNWLYGVAYRTALEARAANARRKRKESRVAPLTRTADVPEEAAWRELRPLLDRELARLPDKYRAAVVLCDLEGKSRREAARLLGWPEGTLSTRLLRGRQRLAGRLAGRGLALSGGVLTATLGRGLARACVPGPLAAATVQAATAVAVGQAAAGAVSAPVAALTEGVLKTMVLSRLKVLLAVLVAVSVLGLGAGLLPRPALAEKPVPAPAPAAGKGPAPGRAPDKAQQALFRQLQSVRWTLLWEPDPANHTIGVTDTPDFPRLDGLDVRPFHFRPLTLEKLAVARDARITLDGAKARLEDLAMGMHVSLRFAEGKPVVTALEATTRREGHVVRAVNAERGTLTVAVGKDVLLQELPVAKDAYIYLFDRGNVGKLADLKAGMRVFLQLVVKDGRVLVTDIRARK
jgi:RNA polymerase sigma factor (sigma-70 family)